MPLCRPQFVPYFTLYCQCANLRGLTVTAIILASCGLAPQPKGVTEWGIGSNGLSRLILSLFCAIGARGGRGNVPTPLAAVGASPQVEATNKVRHNYESWINMKDRLIQTLGLLITLLVVVSMPVSVVDLNYTVCRLTVDIQWLSFSPTSCDSSSGGRNR